MGLNREGLSDMELFIRNSTITGNLLRKSSVGNLVEYHKNNIFPVLSQEEFDAHEKARNECLKDPYKAIREQHHKNTKFISSPNL